MQLLAMIASFIFGRLNNQQRGGGLRETLRETLGDMVDDALLKSRRPVLLVLTGLAAVMFFCGGLFITVLEGTTQYDRVGYVTLTSTMGAGIILFCLAGLGFAYVFAFAWPGATKEVKEKVTSHTEHVHHHASTLEQALTVLVLDFVKEREMRRTQTHAHTGPSADPRTSSSVKSHPADKTDASGASGPIH